MHFAKEACSSEFLIRAYGEGRITVGTDQYRRSLILTTDRVLPDWRPQSYQELEVRDFELLHSLQPEIVLLGTGSTLQFPSPDLTACLAEARIGIEVMDTAAACRTFNILLSEERQVVAALLLG